MVNNLEKIRKAAGLTQAQLAERLNVQQSTITLWGQNLLTIQRKHDIINMQVGRKARWKGGRKMSEMPTNTEYILRMILELIDKCSSLEELRASVKKVLEDAG